MKQRWLVQTIAVVVIAFIGAIGIYSQVESKKLPDDRAGSSNSQKTNTNIYADTDNFGVVRILGVGFIPSESVGVYVGTSFASLKEPINLGQWNVFADRNGKFDTTWFMTDRALTYSVRALGTISARTASAHFGGSDIIFASTADLCQCRNGPASAPESCTGDNWVNGNLNGSQAHYVEGQSVPYRVRMMDIEVGPTHTITIEYDTTEGGYHSFDYLTSFDRTEMTASPCDGIPNCDPLVHQHFTIPIDVNVTMGYDGLPGTEDDIIQIPGAFTLFNGTIVSVSPYTMQGSFTGKSQTSLTVTFTNTDPNPVLAWGGHISTRADWGWDKSAIMIPGSPFHMRLIDLDGGGGNQDRSLQSDAIAYPGQIAIIKDAQPNSEQAFLFTVLGPTVTGEFTLDDDGDNTNTFSNTRAFAELTNFGAGHEVTVTEVGDISPYRLGEIVCTSDPNGGNGTNNNTISIPEKTVMITLEEGEFVTCTFVNARTTAANVMLSGRILDAAGLPIRGALVQATRVSNGQTYAYSSSSFGYYTFSDLTAGESYVVTVTSRRHVFDPPSQIVTLADNVIDLNFTALPD